MSQNSFNKDRHLRTKLDEFQVSIPDFPIKPNRWARFINLLASPAKDPIDPFISTTNGLMLLKITPLLGTAALALIQAFILL